VWRILIREDMAAQVYRGEELREVLAPEVLIDWRLPARGRHLEWTGGVKKAVVRD
jgi:hypothetical protein